MKTTIKRLATLAAVLAAAACSDANPLSPADAAFAHGAAFPMTFTVTQDGSTALQGWSMGMQGAARFGGSMQTPTPCYDLKAENEVVRGRIEVTVTATPLEGGCIQVIAYNNYTGEVTGLAPGRYALRVTHRLNGRDTSAYDGSVVVQ